MPVRYNQAGYVGASRSVGAVIAESEGKLPLTRLCKRFGFARRKVVLYLGPCEAHHSSKYANLTDYYDPCDALRFRRYISTRTPTAQQMAARAEILADTIERVCEAGPLSRYRTPYEAIYGIDPRTLLARGGKLQV